RTGCASGRTGRAATCAGTSARPVKSSENGATKRAKTVKNTPATATTSATHDDQLASPPRVTTTCSHVIAAPTNVTDANWSTLSEPKLRTSLTRRSAMSAAASTGRTTAGIQAMPSVHTGT